MDKYNVLISPKAYRELDSIYQYIKTELKKPRIALKLIELIEENILTLDILPQRGAERKVGVYMNNEK